MTMDRAQRRALERKQRKQENRQEASASPRSFDGSPPLWLLLLVALPVVVVPVYFLYLPPGVLIDGGYGHIIINEFQKYVALLVTLGLLALVGGGFLVWKNIWPRLPRMLVWPVLLLFAGALLSCTVAVDKGYAGLILVDVYLLPVLFFLLVAGLRWGTKQSLMVIGLAFLAGLIVAGIGIAQGFETWDFALKLPRNGAGSLLFTKNLAGEYLITLIPLGLGVVLAVRNWALRLLAAAAVLVFAVHLILTDSRGGWVGLLVGIAVTLGFLLFSVWRSGRKADQLQNAIRVKSFWPIFVAIPLFLVLLLSSPVWLGEQRGTTVIKALKSISWSQAAGRLELWNDGLMMAGDVGLLGTGPGHYKVNVLNHLDEISRPDKRGRVKLIRWTEKSGGMIYPLRPHNDYLQNWIEIGLLGFVGTLWLFGSITLLAYRGLYHASCQGDHARLMLLAGAFGGFASWAVSMFFEFPFRMPASMLLGWFCAGLVVSLSLTVQKKHCWSPLRPALNRLAGLIVVAVVFISFLFGHRVFWGNLYGIQAMTAWNNKKIEQGYEWQTKAYAYAPWEESNGATKARMEMGLKKYEDALATSREILQRRPNSLPSLWIEGYAALALGRKDEGQAAFGTIAEMFPFLPENEKYRELAGLPPVTE